MKRKNLFIIVILVFGFLACGQLNRPSHMEVLTEYESINNLDKAISQAKSDSVDTYAPEGFKKAEEALKKSIKLAQNGETEQAVRVSQKSLGTLQLASDNANRAKKVMWEVDAIRQKAIDAGAKEVSADEFANTEEELRKANKLIENGQVEKAKEQQPELIQLYSDLEKKALNQNVVELAKLAFEQAKAMEAEEYAPKYFKKAKEELDLALQILETDRTRTDKAYEHANTAAKWARNASQISALAKTFTLRDFTFEDTVVWYWDQLREINEPFKDEINFEQPNHIVVQNMQDKISNVKQHYADSQQRSEQLQNTISQLKSEQKQKISKISSQQTKEQRLQDDKQLSKIKTEEKFTATQSLFNPNEAQVYRKGDNILISADGFNFPSGKDEIQSSNFALLDKILKSVKQFPEARIEISGHTDSVGTSDLNMKLSEERAKNVANFISNVGDIPPNKITAKGYGDTKPVASNKTAQGKAQNRRIDVMIVNEK